LNLSNAGLVPCGPDGKSHALSFGGESDGPCVPVGVGLVGWVPIPSEKHRNIMLGGGFKYFLFSPLKLGKMNPI